MNENMRKYRFFILLLFLVICCGAIFIFMDKKEELQIDDRQEIGSLDGKTVEEIQKAIDDSASNNQFKISIKNDLIFKNGKSNGELRIENSADNKLYMRVEIRLKDTNKMIYETDLIKPGNIIMNDRLQASLSKGDYPVIISFFAHDLKNQTKIGETKIESSIKIKE